MGAEIEPPIIADVLTLDGIKNTRAGHNAASAKWEDLSGNNYDFSASTGTPTWAANCLSMETNFALYRNVDLQGNKTAITIEIIAQNTGDGTHKNGNSVLGAIFWNANNVGDINGFKIYSFRSYNTSGKLSDNGVSSYYNNKTAGYIGNGGIVRYMAYVFNGSEVRRFRDGTLAPAGSAGNPITMAYPSGTKRLNWYVGGADSAFYRGNIFYIGVSSRALSDAEIAERDQRFRRRFNF